MRSLVTYSRGILLLLLLLPLAAQAASLAVGQTLPAIEARLIDSDTSHTFGAGSGKVLIINFWATWCAPCRAEMPALQAYYDLHKDEGLELLAVSMDDARDMAEVRKIARQFSFPVAMKNEVNYKPLGRIWRMPSTFIIDRQGVLKKNGHEGEPSVDQAVLETFVTPLLTKSPPP